MKEIVNMIMAGIKFNKTEIGEVTSEKKNTNAAVLLIAFSVILDTVSAFFQGNGGSSGRGIRPG